ncbi:ubiquitin-like FUBI-ribosomal protein eS30 fusion protein [Stigmatopora argus]
MLLDDERQDTALSGCPDHSQRWLQGQIQARVQTIFPGHPLEDDASLNTGSLLRGKVQSSLVHGGKVRGQTRKVRFFFNLSQQIKEI